MDGGCPEICGLLLKTLLLGKQLCPIQISVTKLFLSHRWWYILVGKTSEQSIKWKYQRTKLLYEIIRANLAAEEWCGDFVNFFFRKIVIEISNILSPPKLVSMHWNNEFYPKGNPAQKTTGNIKLTRLTQFCVVWFFLSDCGFEGSSPKWCLSRDPGTRVLSSFEEWRENFKRKF